MFATMVAPMSPSDQFLAVLDRLDAYAKENREERHALRGDISAKMDAIRLELKELSDAISGTDRRVLVIETQREEQRRADGRRQWGIGILAGGLISFLIKAVDWWQGR